MSSSDKPVRVRMAPSPTGYLHLGGARTSLYNYLLARQAGGKFVLRIEDTDRKRFVEGAQQEFETSLRWLGINWDEGTDIGGPYGPYRQSERKEIYQKYARQLIEQGHAYYCFCTPERLEKVRQEQQKNKIPPHYDGTCRNLPLDEAQKRVDSGERHVVRFKTPKEGSTTVHDYLRGDITVENKNLDDYILVKSDGLALYHLAVVVDDHLMKISHVFRGSEWLPTFPLHVLLIKAFGWDQPEWIHLSLFLKPSGKGKMSKRESAELIKDGYSIFVKDLMALGYVPEAVINWIALMGWSYDDHTEFFTMADLIEKFTLDKLNPSPAAINFTKLDYFNGMHIRALEKSDLAQRLIPFFKAEGLEVTTEQLLPIIPIIQERLQGLDDAPRLAGFFFRPFGKVSLEELIIKGESAETSAKIAFEVTAILEALGSMKMEDTEPAMRNYVEKNGYKAGQVFGLMRIAITGQRISPPLFESMEIIGREEVLNRMKSAVETLGSVVLPPNK